jgi:hypothetical protein
MATRWYITMNLGHSQGVFSYSSWDDASVVYDFLLKALGETEDRSVRWTLSVESVEEDNGPTTV